MKRLFFIISSIMVVNIVFLAGCGSRQPQNTAPAAETRQTETAATVNTTTDETTLPDEVQTDRPHFIVTYADFNAYDQISREDLERIFLSPEDNTPEYINVPDVYFMDNPGSLKFFFDGDFVNCVSWTSDIASESLFNDIVNDMLSKGTEGKTEYPKDGQTEMTVRIGSRDYIAGYENSADGEYTYLFSLYKRKNTGDSILIKSTTGYSEGLAWVRHDDAAGDMLTSVIDAEGNILFTLDEDSKELHDFHDGTSVYTVDGTDTDVLVDSSGNELYRTYGSENDTVKMEHICGYANGYYLLARAESSITTNGTKVALLNTDGTIALDYTDEFVKSNDHSDGKNLLTNLVYADTFTYLGKGWYQADTTFLNFDRGLVNSFNNGFGTILSDFTAGEELIILSGSYLAYYDEDLKWIENVRTDGFLGEPKDGLFFSYDHEETGYYDAHLNIVISVNLYPDNLQYGTPFSGGYATLEINGADGNKYITVIDGNGNQMFEPIIVEGYYPQVLDGYLIVNWEDDNYYIIDLNGEKIHYINGDFQGCGISIVMRDDYNITDEYDLFNEGFLEINYSTPSGSFCCLYPLAKAAAAGSSVYDLGYLIPQQEESYPSSEETTTAPRNYTTVNNFSIEGKWKSTGSYGFGQAQPGSIVIFDGNHCNFFSPQDTYVVTRDGDNYILETTSLLSTDTLSFTIKTIDKDHIDIYYGGNITELERIE